MVLGFTWVWHLGASAGVWHLGNVSSFGMGEGMVALVLVALWLGLLDLGSVSSFGMGEGVAALAPRKCVFLRHGRRRGCLGTSCFDAGSARFIMV
ncbi:hypothetical protein L3X38_003827 [Prunus dulcis]|uniref:Uncharacterized protein n=1 Tax=Prunus dulcis TaxID=3755 RepID=A0AAD4ZMV0_PRUDU|nr:hypothetical protein L3X38_003827 [Prunus dulcis]